MVSYSKNKVALIPEIQGRVLQSARQRLNLKPEELAARACLSKKHITQLEEGGISCFYSDAHKVTVAKKVGKLLNLEESQFLIHPDGDQALQNSLQFDIDPADELAKHDPIEKSQVVSTDVRALEESRVASEPVAEKKVTLESIQLAKDRIAKKFSFQISSGAVKWSLLFFVVAGLYITRTEIVDLFLTKPAPVVVSADPVEGSPDSQVLAPPNAVSAPNTPNTPNNVTPLVAVPPLPSEVGCPKADATIAEYRVTEATKSADFVFIQSKSKQIVCVTDASGKSNMQSMDVGSSYTFTGKAPFTVLSNGMSQLGIYFQGRPVRIQGEAVRSIKLQEVKLSQ